MNTNDRLTKQIPKGYKQTEVGVIPEGWQVKQLNEIAEFASGTTPSRDQHQRYFQNGKHHWAKTLDLNNSNIYTTDEKVTDIALKEVSSLKIFPIDTVLIAMYGGFNQIGRTGILKINACVNQALTAIKTNKELLRPLYLINTLNYRVNYWRDVATSSRKDPNITSKDVKEFKIPLPPLPEQQAIAEALSDADALISSLDKLIAKKRDIKQATMQQLLTGKTRLPGFTGEWEVKKLGEVTNATAGGTPSTSRSEYWGGNIRWMNSGELNLKKVYEVENRITELGLQNSSTKIIPPRCVLIGLAGQGKTRGTAAMNMVEVCTNQSIAAVYPSPAFDTDYLYYNLDSRYDELRGLSTGDGGRGGLNLKIIKSLLVPFPVMEEQQAIAQILSDMDADIEVLEAKRDKQKALKQSLMQTLLTGKIRLVKSSS